MRHAPVPLQIDLALHAGFSTRNREPDHVPVTRLSRQWWWTVGYASPPPLTHKVQVSEGRSITRKVQDCPQKWRLRFAPSESEQGTTSNRRVPRLAPPRPTKSTSAAILPIATSNSNPDRTGRRGHRAFGPVCRCVIGLANAWTRRRIPRRSQALADCHAASRDVGSGAP